MLLHDVAELLDFAVSAESAIDALKHLVTLFARITGRPSSDLSASAPSAISVPHPKPHAAKPKPVPLQPPDGSLPALADEFVPKSPCSLRLLFPDGQQADATQWKLALGRVMEWLSSRGLLTSAQCPMPDRAGKSRHLVSTGKLHPSGKPFVEPRELPGGLWYESNYDGKECCENAIHALQRCGVDPESVHWAPLA
ncbi:MAG: hypothetical protein HYU66_27255 [Armatimonadetes bacterium]|nr:hypothetical protein [Armatimonadota bacterium]